MTTQVTTAHSTQEAQWLIHVLENILRPLVRLLYAQRIGYQTVKAVLKRLYIEESVAASAKDNPFKQTTVSEISLNTGVEVKHVKRELESIRANRDADQPDLSWLPAYCAEARILEYWRTKPPFVDEDGVPVLLKAFGTGLSFERLVKRACGNVGPAEVRNRLYEAGCIETVRENGSSSDMRLKLVNPFYVADVDDKRTLLGYASNSIRHLMTALSHNLTTATGDHRFVQQERWSRRIRPADMAEFRDHIERWVREKVEESEALIEDYEVDDFVRDDHVHAGVGLYYFEESPRLRDQFQFAI